MALVLIPLFVSILAGAAVVLIPGLEQKISADIADINGSFVKGVTGPIINAWVVVAVIGAGLGLAIWGAEYEIGRKTGQKIALPDVQPLQLPAAPTFGSSSGLRAGPFTTGIQAGTGQAPPPVVYTSPGPTFASRVAAAQPLPPPLPSGGGGRRGRRQAGSLRATVKA